MGQSTWDQFLARNIWIDVHCLRTTMKFLIVLAFFSAVAIAEETNVAEVTDQQVEAARYGGYGHGYRYGRSVGADTEGQASHYGGYYGHGYGHRYGRSVAADTEGQESHYGGYYPRYSGYHHGYYQH